MRTQYHVGAPKPEYPEPLPHEADEFLLEELEVAAWLLPPEVAMEIAMSFSESLASSRRACDQ